MHRACHAAQDVKELRQLGLPNEFVEPQIQNILDVLHTTHHKWYERSIIRDAEEAEREGRRLFSNLSSTRHKAGFPTQPVLASAIDIAGVFPTTSNDRQPYSPFQFLDYPTMLLTNPFYANLLNHWRSIEILISLIKRHIWSDIEPRILHLAIDLCRTHAALGAERNYLTTGKIWGLHSAGVIFGGPDLYPVYHPSRVNTNPRGNHSG
jgi:hypothetical protein